MADMTVAEYEDLFLQRREEVNVHDRAGMEQMTTAVGLPVDIERCQPRGGLVRIVFRDENDLIGIYDALTALDGVRHEPFKE